MYIFIETVVYIRRVATLLCESWGMHSEYFTFHQTQGARETRSAETSDAGFFPPTLWLPNSPDVNFIDYVDYVVWGILQDRVYKNQIRDYSGDYGYDGIYDQKVSMLDVWYRADCLCENDTFWPAFSFMNA